MPTICAACEHVYIVNKSDRYWRWLCMRSPVTEINYVTGTIDPPWRRCLVVNNGACTKFEPDKHPEPKDSIERHLNMIEGDNK